MNAPRHIDNPVLSGKVCPYCNHPSAYVDNAEIYGKSYGMVYHCKPCSAWVGVHKGTNVALGRLANAELRHWKKQAHEWFDGLWLQGGMSRHGAYAWLSNAISIPRELTHIGMFDVDQCKKVVDLCKEKLKCSRLKT